LLLIYSIHTAYKLLASAALTKDLYIEVLQFQRLGLNKLNNIHNITITMLFVENILFSLSACARSSKLPDAI